MSWKKQPFGLKGKKNLTFLYKGIIDIKTVSIKCYLQGNKQGYKNFIEAEKVSNSVVFLANQILCLSALNDRGIPCDHVKNDNVTVNWQ